MSFLDKLVNQVTSQLRREASKSVNEAVKNAKQTLEREEIIQRPSVSAVCLPIWQN